MMDNFEYVVYNDGIEWRRCSTEDEAFAVTVSYNGDHEVWYEVEKIQNIH